jgi:hypothetical protein
VERIIRSIKDITRRFLTMEPAAYWSDALPYCLMALRHTPASAHGFPPFTIITGTTPVLPTQLPDAGLQIPEDPTPEEEADFVQQLMGRVEAIRDQTSTRLQKRDRLVRAALRRRA